MRSGATLRACFLSSASAANAEVIAAAGFDAVLVDCQHGQVSDRDLVDLVRTLESAGVAVLVRVARNAPELIGRALDAGADGVVVPLVESADQAREAVAATRYPPTGARSFGPLRSAALGATDPATADADIVLAVMIETIAGRDHAHEIAAVPGVDAVLVGPVDLALSAGWAPTLDPPSGSDHEGAVIAIADDVLGAGAAVWIAGASVAAWSRWRHHGFGLVTVGSDLSLLAGAARAAARSDA